MIYFEKFKMQTKFKKKNIKKLKGRVSYMCQAPSNKTEQKDESGWLGLMATSRIGVGMASPASGRTHQPDGFAVVQGSSCTVIYASKTIGGICYKVSFINLGVDLCHRS